MAEDITVQTSIHGREFGLDVAGYPVYKLLDGTQERGITGTASGLSGSTPQIFNIGNKPAMPASVAAVKPYAETTGVAFYDQFNEAMLKAQTAGGGRVTIYPGTYYSKRLTGGETRRLVDGVYLQSEVPGGALIQAATDATPNKSNLFEANNVHGWTLDGFLMDGNRGGSAQVQLGDTDALDNDLRIVNCRDFTVRNNTFRNARQHGVIGVQTLTGFLFENNRAYGNGWRSAHIHAENNKGNRRGRVTGFYSYRNGQSGYHYYQGLVSTNSTTTITLPAGDGAKLAMLFSSVSTSVLVRIPGAGNGGGDLFSYVSSVNSGADTAVLSTTASATLSNVPMYAMGDTNSGLFVCYGGEELILSGINIYEEPGNGIQLTGLNDGLWTGVGQWMGTVVPGTLTRVRFGSADYTALKAAYNALTGPQQAATTITIDLAGEQSSEHTTTIAALNDADNSVTLATAAINAVRRARVDVAYSVASAGTLRRPTSGIAVNGMTINDCGIGINMAQCQGVGFSNTHVRNAMIYGAWLQSCQDVGFDAGSTIRDSGVNNIVIQAPADGSQPTSLTDSKSNRFLGTYSGSGASCVRIGNSANTRVYNNVFGPTSVVEGGGSNSHFRQSTNYLGATCAVGIRASNDAGSGLCENPKIFGQVARNWLGGVRLAATAGRGGAYPGSRIYDNVDPSAVSLGTASGKGARAVETTVSCSGLVLIGVDFNCQDRINESYTLGLSASTDSEVIFCDFTNETRNSGNGGLNVAFGSATTLHYGNRFNTSAAYKWDTGTAGVTTIPTT